MFIDKNEQQASESQSFFSSKKNIVILIASIFIISFLIIGILFYLSYLKNRSQLPQGPVATTTSENGQATSSWPGGLPGDENGNGDGDENGNGDGQRAETLAFGNFYQKINDDFEATPATYELPINVKTDVANYYDISRKIDLDDSIESLNNDGFIVINNPFSNEANNFYSLYDLLSNKNIPVVITSDFIIYYYQNILKKVFKEIEGNVFYENLWAMNMKFYKIAKARYERILAETGVTNDPVLEAARTEVVYFAVALKLLEPKDNQIAGETALTERNKFSIQEANKFNIKLPTYLETQVKRELNLINEANSTSKSPIFLYDYNYRKFQIPVDYQNSARLYNFYLATVWLNSLFPLYYQGEACPNCLLDRDDWRINFITSCLIANDFSNNQDIKNEWAIVYKVLSFFEGLRGDLIYLHYIEALEKAFGLEYDIEELFSLENENREHNFDKLQEKIIGMNFSEIEGALDRSDNNQRSLIGLKILSDYYWPDNYIFKQLLYPKVDRYLNEVQENAKISTICKDDEPYRCKGIGLDIINLVYPITNENINFQINSNYENYEEQAIKMRQELGKFDIYSWRNNNFWTTLDINRVFLENDKNFMPVFTRSYKWQMKDINTSLAAWVNMKLPMDKFIYYTKSDPNILGQVAQYNQFNYIVPNIDLIQELRANTLMLLDMLTALGITSETNSVAIELQELDSKLEGIESIQKKILNNEEFEGVDLKTIESFIKQYSVSSQGNKEYTINFGKILEENRSKRINLSNVKLLILIYNKGDNKYFAMGPVFNYIEY